MQSIAFFCFLALASGFPVLNASYGDGVVVEDPVLSFDKSLLLAPPVYVFKKTPLRSYSMVTGEASTWQVSVPTYTRIRAVARGVFMIYVSDFDATANEYRCFSTSGILLWKYVSSGVVASSETVSTQGDSHFLLQGDMKRPDGNVTWYARLLDASTGSLVEEFLVPEPKRSDWLGSIVWGDTTATVLTRTPTSTSAVTWERRPGQVVHETTFGRVGYFKQLLVSDDFIVFRGLDFVQALSRADLSLAWNSTSDDWDSSQECHLSGSLVICISALYTRAVDIVTGKPRWSVSSQLPYDAYAFGCVGASSVGKPFVARMSRHPPGKPSKVRLDVLDAATGTRIGGDTILEDRTTILCGHGGVALANAAYFLVERVKL